jgi:hypothetical protein
MTATLSLAQDIDPSRKKGPKRFYLGLVFPDYKNNPEHTIDTKSEFSFNLGLKRTFVFFQSEFDIGLEYVNQNFSFDSYYFAPGYSVLYDKTFPFEHDVNINEFQVPVLFRQTYGNESRSKVTTYFTVGWILRYFAYSSTSIEDIATGVQVYDGKTNISFEYPLLLAQLGSMIQGGFGMQFNNIQTKKSNFIELNYRLAISRFHYTGYDNSNDLLIRDSNFTFTIGHKF